MKRPGRCASSLFDLSGSALPPHICGLDFFRRIDDVELRTCVGRGSPVRNFARSAVFAGTVRISADIVVAK
jgi:hypothetical protein